MASTTTFIRKNYVLFVLFVVMLMAGVLTWSSYKRFQDFQHYQYAIAQESVLGVAEQVERFVKERNRLVNVFATQNLHDIRALAGDPRNSELHDQLRQRIALYFPDYFAFTVASPQGDPLFEDFDGLVADSCRADIKQYVGDTFYHPYLHPNYQGYHFDVMAPYGENEGVLFISFHADILGGILRAAQSPQHQLMLVYPQRNDLIEVIADGARNRIVRNDYRLSDVEKARILIRVPVEGTRWEAVDLHSPKLFDEFMLDRIVGAGVIFAIFVAAGVFFVMRLRREESQREIAERHKNELMGVISHELRTPAAAIHGALQLVMRGATGEVNAETKSMVSMACNNTERLITLVSDFLDLQKLESGHLKFELHNVDIVSLVRQSVENNKMYAEKMHVSFEFEDNEHAINVKCDDSRIEQVVTNLLSNAAKYGCENDHILIRIDTREDDVKVSVTDHGGGIAVEYRDKIFEKFVMTSAAKKDGVRSSGLGLSIVKAIIDKHDGKIGFDTELGKGTTFYFILPISRK